MATYPSAASRSTTVGSQLERPKISWITITAGALAYFSSLVFSTAE
jgi:hypothetical protein